MLDNCAVYKKKGTKDHEDESSSQHSGSPTTQSTAKLATPFDQEELIEEIVRRIAPPVKPQFREWCEIEQKWTDHTKEECYYNQGFGKERNVQPSRVALVPPKHSIGNTQRTIGALKP